LGEEQQLFISSAALLSIRLIVPGGFK